MPVTKEQADMLAVLACASRPHGAPRWDAAGVAAAIGKVKHLHLADVALAVFRAADARDVQTPGVIANTASPCWKERGTRPAEHDPFDRNTFCGICGESRDRCVRKWAADHTFEAIARTKPADVDVARTVQGLRQVKATPAHEGTDEQEASA